MSDWLGLEGQRVVIAGGAGSFGAALAKGFRDQGSAVAVIDIQPGDHIQADLRDPDAARSAMAEAARQLGGIDVFVHGIVSGSLYALVAVSFNRLSLIACNVPVLVIGSLPMSSSPPGR